MSTQWRAGEWIDGRWEVYDIRGGAGKSGMGIVYIIYDHEWHEVFAGKTVQDRYLNKSEVIARFDKEAEAWIMLGKHPFIVQARLLRYVGQQRLLLLEYVDGTDLRQWINTPRLDLRRTLRFSTQICLAMEHANVSGIRAHRDIKPSNLMITHDEIAKLTDFGLVKMLDELSEPVEGLESTELQTSLKSLGTLYKPESDLSANTTHTSAIMGTLAYMAPEQFLDAKRVGVCSDIYSVGVMLYEMISGHLPFQATTPTGFAKLHLEQEPPKLSSVIGPLPDRLLQIVRICLDKDPVKRFQSFKEIRENLSDLLAREFSEIIVIPTVAELDVDELLRQGVTLKRLGHIDEALQCFKHALEKDANNVRTHAAMFMIQSQLKSMENAEQINMGDGFKDRKAFREGLLWLSSIGEMSVKFIGGGTEGEAARLMRTGINYY